jgi:hypothetical protein
MAEPHRINPENAKAVWKWLLLRGGISLWQSVDLSDPGKTWMTPTLLVDKPYPKPSWQSAETPFRHITDPDEVLVDIPKEVKRFRVGVENAGMQFIVTAGGSRKIREAVSKAREQHGVDVAWYEFDYMSQEAVILVPDRSLLIRDYILETLGEFDGQGSSSSSTGA